MNNKFFKAVVLPKFNGKDRQQYVLSQNFKNIETALAYAKRESYCDAKIQVREYSSPDDVDFLHTERDRGLVVLEEFCKYDECPCHSCKNAHECDYKNLTEECASSNYKLFIK